MGGSHFVKWRGRGQRRCYISKRSKIFKNVQKQYRNIQKPYRNYTETFEKIGQFFGSPTESQVSNSRGSALRFERNF